MALGPRFVSGPFGDIGYIIKRPGHGVVTEELLKLRIQYRAKNARILGQKRDSTREAIVNECWQNFDAQSLHARANRICLLGLQQADRELVGKQNKLKQLLLEEQSHYSYEYVEKAQNALKIRLERERKVAEAILNERVNMDEKYARSIYEKIAMKGEANRDKTRVDCMKLMYQTLEEQIRLKNLERKQAEEDDRLENEAAEKKSVQMKQEKDRENASIQQKKLVTMTRYKEQIEERERICQNEVCINELEKSQLEELYKTWEYERKKKEEEEHGKRVLYAQELAAQVRDNRVRAASYQLEKLNFERMMDENMKRKAEQEIIAETANRKKAWKEMTLFVESTVQNRKAIASEEQEFNRVAEELNRVSELKRYEARKAKEDIWKEYNKDCAPTTKNMIFDKVVKKSKQRAMDKGHTELSQHYQKTNERLDDIRSSHRQKEVMLPFLREQTKYLAALQERQKLADDEMLRKMRHFREESNEAVRTPLERPLPQIAGTSLHPFYTVVRSNGK